MRYFEFKLTHIITQIKWINSLKNEVNKTNKKGLECLNSTIEFFELNSLS